MGIEFGCNWGRVSFFPDRMVCSRANAESGGRRRDVVVEGRDETVRG